MQEKLKVAFIGLGRIASLLEDDSKREKPASHAGAFSLLPDCEFVAACDLQEEKCLEFKKRWVVSNLFENPETMLKQVKVDILIISTYPDSHAILVKMGIVHSVPVIVCEKPLTDSIASAKKLVKAIGKSCSALIVNHERRYARDYNRVLDIIKSGQYGKLRSINAKLFMGRNRTTAEVLLWDGTHMFDILRYITQGEFHFDNVSGDSKSKNSCLFISGHITSKIIIHKPFFNIEIATDRDHLVFELDLSFEKGRIRIGNGLYEEFHGDISPLYDKMRSLIPTDFQKNEIEPTEYFSGMAAAARNLCWEMKRWAGEKSLKPKARSTEEDGLQALILIDKVLKKTNFSLVRLIKTEV